MDNLFLSQIHVKLTRFGVRDYDSETGSWTSKEPLGFNGSRNFYVYADNDGVNYWGLNGLYVDTVRAKLLQLAASGKYDVIRSMIRDGIIFGKHLKLAKELLIENDVCPPIEKGGKKRLENEYERVAKEIKQNNQDPCKYLSEQYNKTKGKERLKQLKSQWGVEEVGKEKINNYISGGNMLLIAKLVSYIELIDDIQNSDYLLNETSFLLTAKDEKEGMKKALELGKEYFSATSEGLKYDNRPAKEIFANVSELYEPFDLHKFIDEVELEEILKADSDLGELNYSEYILETKEDLEKFLNNKPVKVWFNIIEDLDSDITDIVPQTTYNGFKIPKNNNKIKNKIKGKILKKLLKINKLTLKEIADILEVSLEYVEKKLDNKSRDR